MICGSCHADVVNVHEYPECPGSAPEGYVTVNLADLLTVLEHMPKSGTPIPDYAHERVEWHARRKSDFDAALKAAHNARQDAE